MAALRDPERGSMSVREAARRGGQATAARYSGRWYRKNQQKAVPGILAHGQEFYRECGRRGGAKTRAFWDNASEEERRQRAQKRQARAATKEGGRAGTDGSRQWRMIVRRQFAPPERQP